LATASESNMDSSSPSDNNEASAEGALEDQSERGWSWVWRRATYYPVWGLRTLLLKICWMLECLHCGWLKVAFSLPMVLHSVYRTSAAIRNNHQIFSSDLRTLHEVPCRQVMLNPPKLPSMSCFCRSYKQYIARPFPQIKIKNKGLEIPLTIAKTCKNDKNNIRYMYTQHCAVCVCRGPAFISTDSTTCLRHLLISVMWNIVFKTCVMLCNFVATVIVNTMWIRGHCYVCVGDADTICCY